MIIYHFAYYVDQECQSLPVVSTGYEVTQKHRLHQCKLHKPWSGRNLCPSILCGTYSFQSSWWASVIESQVEKRQGNMLVWSLIPHPTSHIVHLYKKQVVPYVNFQSCAVPSWSWKHCWLEMPVAPYLKKLRGLSTLQ